MSHVAGEPDHMKLEAEVNGTRHHVEVDRYQGDLSVSLDGKQIPLDARPMDGFFLSLLIDGRAYEVTVEPDGYDWRVQVGIEAHKVAFLDPLRQAEASGGPGAAGRASGGRATVASLMPGKVVRVLVKEGDEVQEGQDLVVVEAMKMENAVSSPRAGKVLELKVQPGEAVESGATLAVIG